MFKGFDQTAIDTASCRINLVRGGTGPAVVMLHGYPQTHTMWHAVAPALAGQFTVVCPDLRGYGDSEKPRGDPAHRVYSKRTMANDVVEVMAALGIDRFTVVGHDRGARVALRLALDHPTLVTRLAVLDIVPTRVIYRTIDMAHAMTVWRYFFLAQPPDLPERLIGANPDYYLNWTFDEWGGSPAALTDEARAEYRRCFDTATIHASCEDYRAGATVDLTDDEQDADRGLDCPVFVLWSAKGLGASYDVLGIWQERASRVRGRALDCGHFLAEERPRETADEILRFLSD